jgi:hypothetical protein
MSNRHVWVHASFVKMQFISLHQHLVFLTFLAAAILSSLFLFCLDKISSLLASWETGGQPNRASFLCKDVKRIEKILVESGSFHARRKTRQDGMWIKDLP